MRKYTVLVAAVVMQLCLGGIYAWSAFAPALNREFGYSAAQTQSVFGITVGVLCLGSLLGGRMQDLWGPRPAACLSGVLLGLGYYVAGVAGNRFCGLLLGVSLLCGLGLAFGYVTSISAAARWFPHRRGLVTGVVVSGYGCAAILLSAAAGWLLARGWPVLRVFRVAGIVYGCTVAAAGLTLSVPDAGAQAAAVKAFRRLTLLGDRRFWRLAAGISCATYPGLALIGALKPLGAWQGHSPLVASASISALAIGNGAGRIAWGYAHDRLSGRDAVTILLVAVVLSVLLFAAGGANGTLFLVAAAALGFCYGGALAVFPSEVAAAYGAHLVGTVYPLILLAHGAVAIVAAPLTGWGVDATGGYWPGMVLALVAATAGAGLCVWLRPRP